MFEPNPDSRSVDFTAAKPIAVPAVDGTLTSRYECKYLLSPGQVEAVRDYMRPYVRPDRFARKRPGYRYAVSSLYLDTAELMLFQMTMDGNKNRYKLRIRTYGDHPEDPVFFEVKKRMDGIVYKRRCRLNRRGAKPFFDSIHGGPRRPVSTNVDLEEFGRLAREIVARPVMRIKYVREAYESAAGDPVRLTFDSELISSMTLGYNLSHSGHDWVPTPLEGTVLELKFTERYPPWVGELVERFDLGRTSVAKYVLSMEKALLEGRCRRPAFASQRRVPPIL